MDYIQHIEGLQNGSYKDFKILYDAFSGNLYGFVFGLVKSESMSKDVVQETFIKVWINRKSIDPQLSFKSYLFKISRNLIIDNFRKQMSDPVFENYLDYQENMALSINNDESIERKIDFDLFVRQLDKAKESLTPRQREIFELNKEQGISSAKIAELLNINEQTVYNQLSSALKILKKEINPIFFSLFCFFFA